MIRSKVFADKMDCSAAMQVLVDEVNAFCEGKHIVDVRCTMTEPKSATAFAHYIPPFVSYIVLYNDEVGSVRN